MVRFEIASYYTRLRWELDVKLERKRKKRSPDKRITNPMWTTDQLLNRRCSNQALEEHIRHLFLFPTHSCDLSAVFTSERLPDSVTGVLERE